MIRKIVLENFKCFHNITADMGRITLLTGANSSGKSSFLHSILLLMQSDLFPFDISINGEFVQLGGPKEISYNHDTSAVIKVGFVIKMQPVHRYGDIEIITQWNKSSKGNSLALYSLKVNKGQAKLMIDMKGNNWIVTFILPGEYSLNTRLDEGFKKYVYDLLKTTPIKSFQDGNTNLILEQIPITTDLRSYVKYLPELYVNESVQYKSNRENPLYVLISALDHIMYSKHLFNYINSYEIPPVRTYYQMSNYGSKVKSNGEGFEQQLLFWNEMNDKQLKTLREEMKKLKAVKNIEIKNLSGGRFEIIVSTINGKLKTSLVDIGFGISQLLPIIIADLQLDKDSVLAISQPERHLHPSMQADLMDYFINNCSKKQYIIETHSEYMINRLRLRIAEGSVNPNDVKCYYFENNGVGTKEHRIAFNKDGSISNAPKSFFETYLCDSMKIALAAVK